MPKSSEHAILCRVCEKHVNPTTGICTFCGSKHVKNFSLKVSCIVVTLIILFAVIIYSSLMSTNTPIFSENTNFPEDQQLFINTMTQYKDQFIRGKETAKDDIYIDVIVLNSQRKQDIQKFQIGPKIENWVGTIELLQKIANDKISLRVDIAPFIALVTHSSDLDDVDDKTLITSDCEIFKELMYLRQGDKVVFSGSFIESSTDVFKNKNYSLDASLSRPVLLFKFESIRKE